MFRKSFKNQQNVRKGFMLHMIKEPLIQQKFDESFFVVKPNNLTGSEILSQLMPMCIQKIFFEIRDNRTLKFSMICFGFQSKKNITKFSMQLLKFFFNFVQLINANKGFNFFTNQKRSYIKNVDDKLRVALSSIESNIE